MRFFLTVVGAVRQYQQTDAVNYLVEGSYSPGMMISETYPSVPGAADRRTVTYTPDTAGRLASLNSNATTYAPAASVASIGYASSNALSTETYGNSKREAKRGQARRAMA